LSEAVDQKPCDVGLTARQLDLEDYLQDYAPCFPTAARFENLAKG
jgi:hypothetical protein